MKATALGLCLGLVLLPLRVLGKPEVQVLFNGRDLAGWDGNPDYWKVEDGIIKGTTVGAEPLAHNQFLVWRGGVLADFEFSARIRQVGNNSGVQYRSREYPDVGPWVVGGYQCDIHPVDRNNGQLFEERGRRLIGRNGHSIIVDPTGEKWIVEELEMLPTDDARWHEYSIIARGNHIEHRIDGRTVFRLADFDLRSRSLTGLLAFQLHRGPAMTVEIKDIRLKVLPPVSPTEFRPGLIPPSAAKVELPAPAR